MFLDLRAQGHLQIHIVGHPAKAKLPLVLLRVELLALALVLAENLRQDLLFLAEGGAARDVVVLFFFSDSVHAPSPEKVIIVLPISLQP